MWFLFQAYKFDFKWILETADHQTRVFCDPTSSSHCVKKLHRAGFMKFYGMGTFNLAWSIGSSDAYGHVGDTYGYQSQTTYVPADDFVITVTW